MTETDSTISLGDITTFIEKIVSKSSLNLLNTIDGGLIFDVPLVGVADGQDPLFTEYKQVIGDFYLTPVEALQKMAEVERYCGNLEAIAVVCWALPFATHIRASNAMKNDLPASSLWSCAQEFGEKFNNHLRLRVIEFFKNRGYLAIAPMRSPFYVRFGRYSTNWSERHALYAAGMGTFGLSRWLITERGVAMRCGSVVVNAQLTPTPRRYASHTENCLYYSAGPCNKCIDRCPAEAITVDGLNKAKCREFLDLHAKVEGCGLCQTSVPCESTIPR